MDLDTGSLHILDCTLRDGSYPIQFQFTAEDTYRITRTLDRAGIPLVEVGHGMGLNAQSGEGGKAAATDREYIEAAVEAAEDAHVGVFYIPGIGRPEDIEMAADAGLDYIRLGQNVTDWQDLKPAIETASEQGLTVCGNLMKSYAAPPSDVADRCADLEKWGADVVYIVDSAGGMLPSEVDDYVSSTVAAVSDAAVGFHCHDNLDLAVANSLQAIEVGAEWIDATLQGIGRSAGNTRLETLATVLEKRGHDLDIDEKMLMDLGVEEIQPLLDAGGIDSLDVTAGYALFHTKFLDDIFDVSSEYDLDVRDLMIAVSERDTVDVSRGLIERVAEELAGSGRASELGRKTSYLHGSRQFEQSEARSDVESPMDLAEVVDREARKLGRQSVISLSPSFSDLRSPEPTVTHRSHQAVLGNVQVGDDVQAKRVFRTIDGLVDTIAIDVTLDLVLDGGVQSETVRFDDALAIARAVASLIGQRLETSELHVYLHGSHPVIGYLITLWENRDWTVSAHSTASERIPAMDGLRDSVSVVSAFEDLSDVDAVVGFVAPDESLIDATTIQQLSPSLVVDGSIGSLSESAIASARSLDVDVVRSDTRAGYITEVESALITRELITDSMGTGEITGERLVAGGTIGSRGDIVVDSITNPSRVYGIADGSGGLVDSLDAGQEQRLQTVRDAIRSVE